MGLGSGDADAETPGGVLDLVRLAQILEPLGAQRIAELAAMLGQDIQDTPTNAPPTEVEALIRRLHRLRGGARTLGFTALGAELESWELALARGEDGAEEARRVHAAQLAAADALADVLAEAAQAHAPDRTSR